MINKINKVDKKIVEKNQKNTGSFFTTWYGLSIVALLAIAGMAIVYMTTMRTNKKPENRNETHSNLNTDVESSNVEAAKVESSKAEVATVTEPVAEVATVTEPVVEVATVTEPVAEVAKNVGSLKKSNLIARIANFADLKSAKTITSYVGFSALLGSNIVSRKLTTPSGPGAGASGRFNAFITNRWTNVAYFGSVVAGTIFNILRN